MKVKYILYLILTISLYSCSNEEKNDKVEHQKEQIEIDTAIQQPVDDYVQRLIDSHVQVTSFDMMKKHSHEGIRSFDMDSLNDEDLAMAELQFAMKYLDGLKVGDSESWKIYANEYGPIYFVDWEENENFLLFTFLQDDESCCHTLYIGVMTKPDSVIRASELALSGGDGGWGETAKYERTAFGEFIVDSWVTETDWEIENGKEKEKSYEEYSKIKHSVNLISGMVQKDTLERTQKDTVIITEMNK